MRESQIHFKTNNDTGCKEDTDPLEEERHQRQCLGKNVVELHSCDSNSVLSPSDERIKCAKVMISTEQKSISPPDLKFTSATTRSKVWNSDSTTYLQLECSSLKDEMKIGTSTTVCKIKLSAEKRSNGVYDSKLLPRSLITMSVPTSTTSTMSLSTKTRSSESVRLISRQQDNISDDDLGDPDFILGKVKTKFEDELEKKARERQMTCAQEVCNALTMLAPVLYALYFMLMGKWITEEDLEQAKQGGIRIYNDINIHADNKAFFSNGHEAQYFPQFFEEQKHCFASSLFPHVYAFPPLPTLSMFLGFLFHAPCSIYYHLLCAFKLPSGPKRMTHWSRRLDQVMIHSMSVFHCLGYSGNVDYTLFVLAFSLDSMYRLFQGGDHRPRRILARMILAFILPILPLLSHGRVLEFCQLIAIFATGGWLFSAYP